MPNYLYHADSYAASPDIVLHHDAELSPEVFEAVVSAAEGAVAERRLRAAPGAVLRYDQDLFSEVCLELMAFGFQPLRHAGEVSRAGWNHVTGVQPCLRCGHPQLVGVPFRPEGERPGITGLEHRCPTPEVAAIVAAMRMD